MGGISGLILPHKEIDPIEMEMELLVPQDKEGLAAKEDSVAKEAKEGDSVDPREDLVEIQQWSWAKMTKMLRRELWEDMLVKK